MMDFLTSRGPVVALSPLDLPLRMRIDRRGGRHYAIICAVQVLLGLLLAAVIGWQLFANWAQSEPPFLYGGLAAVAFLLGGSGVIALQLRRFLADMAIPGPFLVIDEYGIADSRAFAGTLAWTDIARVTCVRPLDRITRNRLAAFRIEARGDIAARRTSWRLGCPPPFLDRAPNMVSVSLIGVDQPHEVVARAVEALVTRHGGRFVRCWPWPFRG